MTFGYDVCTKSFMKSKSWRALVATMDFKERKIQHGTRRELFDESLKKS